MAASGSDFCCEAMRRGCSLITFCQTLDLIRARNNYINMLGFIHLPSGATGIKYIVKLEMGSSFPISLSPES